MSDLEKIKAHYLDNKLSNREIAQRFGMSSNNVAMLARRHGWPMRGSWWRAGQERGRKKKSIAYVFGGMAQQIISRGNPEIEAAKTKLRRLGCVVYDAAITDGNAGMGYIKCDGRRLTPQELIARAGP